MELTGNSILITGGGSGIGRGLAEAFHQLGNEVLVVGRRQEALQAVVEANPGIRAQRADVDTPEGVAALADLVRREVPKLNVLINNAGIMPSEDLREGTRDLPQAERTITTNLLGPLRLTAALMPQLLAQPHGAIMTVTSGLAFSPIFTNPTYCATKAAVHSWTQSLRFQLRGTGLEVLELVPPYTQTELTGAHQVTDPNAMPLDEYIRETMELLKNVPPNGEVLVKRVYPQRFGEREGRYDEIYEQRNEMAAKRMAARAEKG